MSDKLKPFLVLKVFDGHLQSERIFWVNSIEISTDRIGFVHGTIRRFISNSTFSLSVSSEDIFHLLPVAFCIVMAEVPLGKYHILSDGWKTFDYHEEKLMKWTKIKAAVDEIMSFSGQKKNQKPKKKEEVIKVPGPILSVRAENLNNSTIIESFFVRGIPSFHGSGVSVSGQVNVLYETGVSGRILMPDYFPISVEEVEDICIRSGITEEGGVVLWKHTFSTQERLVDRWRYITTSYHQLANKIKNKKVINNTVPFPIAESLEDTSTGFNLYNTNISERYRSVRELAVITPFNEQGRILKNKFLSKRVKKNV